MNINVTYASLFVRAIFTSAESLLEQTIDNHFSLKSA